MANLYDGMTIKVAKVAGKPTIAQKAKAGERWSYRSADGTVRSVIARVANDGTTRQQRRAARRGQA